MTAETLRDAARDLRATVIGCKNNPALVSHGEFKLAVADWLDAEAHNAEVGIQGQGFHSVGGQSAALTVAHAWLGEE